MASYEGQKHIVLSTMPASYQLLTTTSYYFSRYHMDPGIQGQTCSFVMIQSHGNYSSQEFCLIMDTQFLLCIPPPAIDPGTKMLTVSHAQISTIT